MCFLTVQTVRQKTHHQSPVTQQFVQTTATPLPYHSHHFAVFATANSTHQGAEEGMKLVNRSTTLFISLNVDYVYYRAVPKSNQHYTPFRMFNCLTSDIHTNSLRCCDKARVQCRLHSKTEFRNTLIGWREGLLYYAYLYERVLISP